MQQPNIIEYWTDEAVRQTVRENILQVLAIRLRPETGDLFKAALDAIDDQQRLEELLRAAVLAESVDDFRQALAEN